MRLINILRAWYQTPPSKMGTGCVIETTAVFQMVEGITLGDYVRIGPGCIINGEGGVEIGDGTILGPRVVILSSTHEYMQENLLPYHAKSEMRPVKIGRGVWIGWGAQIVPGVEIEDGAVVAMGAVVTKKVSKGQVVGGNPAKEITHRPAELVDRLVAEKKYYIEAKLNKHA